MSSVLGRGKTGCALEESAEVILILKTAGIRYVRDRFVAAREQGSCELEAQVHYKLLWINPVVRAEKTSEVPLAHRTELG